ncbi:DUF4430 domain-containing protein [Vagococcus carniphilus]|uniref:DUF4430 domain-containing protein n=1 Tax=Vagococcus carniphilus TaxID=218144 RepID=A0AAW8U3L0_9ENTE|nr:DUF4430 domain-containing protein [Vagococcus carniphilus]MDT2829786.1 DUF4430 domain-containing protein [Vagococcus carniphilus]MDT2834200.1 DUF4430 domain-containing protein [Vagococcus carniphilus]MDT2839245.1 DUF4430 domain-containing protein [Vagococcus carniphilus]MDT2853304.1 DUF4430 domain-containing protein [Vagococcus carniphilus]
MKINFKKKTKLSLSLLVCSSALLLGGTGAFAWDGVEDVKEPKQVGEVYQIGSAEELAWFAKEVNSGKTIDAVLTKDIDLENKGWNPIGLSGFKGNFNGNNFEIKGFKIENATGWQGFFGKNEGTIANFSIDGSISTISGNGTGSVTPWNAENGVIDNVSSSVNVSSTNTKSMGGIAGQNTLGGIIKNTEFSGEVNGQSNTSTTQHIGGITGTNNSGDIIGNINYGNVLGTNLSKQTRVGGLVGTWDSKNSSTIANNINYGKVTSNSKFARIAGLIGFYNNTAASNADIKDVFINSINFGTVSAEQPTAIDNLINSKDPLEKDKYFNSKNNFDGLRENFDTEEATTQINKFDGSDFQVSIPESAKFNLAKDGSVKLTSQLNRSKEEPVDEEKLKEAQEYVEKASKALSDASYRPVPTFGEDNNINSMVEKKLEQLGFSDIKISLKSTSDEDYIAKDGTIHYYYKNPNESDWMRFRNVTVAFELTKNGAKSEYKPFLNTSVHWDRDRLTKDTQEQIADKLTLENIKGENESIEKFDKNLVLPKHVDEKKWATVEWFSSNPNLISIDNSLQTGGSSNLYKPFIGKIKRDEKDQKVTLYAVIKNNLIELQQPELKIEKEIEVTIKGLGAGSKDEIQALMDEHYTFDKMTDSVTKEKINPEQVVNDIGLPNPKGTGVPSSHLYQFSAVSNAPDVLTANGYRLAILRPLPGEPAKKASFTVTMKDRNSTLSANKTFEVMIQPLSQKEIDDEIKLMDAAKANYFNGLNKAGNSDPSNITERLNTFQQVSFKEDGKTLNWVYDYKDLKDKGIVPVSIDEAKPSEQWDKFHSSNNAILQHESLFLTKPEHDAKVTVKSVLSSSVFEKYAKQYPDNKDLQKLYRQPVSVDLVVKGKNGENPKPEEKRKVSFSMIGEKESSSYTNWLTTTGEGDEYTSVFDIFKKAMDDNGYTFVGSNYISSITNPSGVTLTHKEHGPSSGWMYAVNGVIVDLMPADQMIEDGDQITWFYVEDYQTDPRIKDGKFTAEPNQESAMKKAQRLIAAIGDVTLEKEEAIQEAREALEQVEDKGQLYIILHVQLEEKENQLKAIKLEVQNKEEAKKVEDLISSIGEVTLTSEPAILKASQAYDELTEEAKKLVSNHDALETAKETYSNLVKEQENKEAAKTVVETIDQLGTPTMANKAQVELARQLFDALTEEQKALVTNLETLTTAEKTVEELVSNIDAVNEAIENLPETISLNDKEAVAKALALYNALPEASRVFVSNLEFLENANKQVKLLEEAQPVVDLINNIGEVTLSSESAIKDARQAFDKLSTDAQANVLNLETLTEAEDKLKELKGNESSEKELKAHKEAAIKSLNEYKNLKDYRKAEQDEINNILKEATASIEKASDKAAVDGIVKETNTKLDKVKTDKELTPGEKSPQGDYIKDGRYVTINKKGYNTWSNFNWKKRNSTDKLVGETYQARGKYKHENGSTYLSLYDNNGKWHGYINEKAVNVGDGKQGAYIKDGRYVTITKGNYDIWSNFGWKKRNFSGDLLNQTFQARGRYKHMNGATYYSLYNDKGEWQGYINANATKVADGKQGAYISDGRYVTISKGNYDIWSNFNWKKRNSSKNVLNETFQVRGRYEHMNGATYYSLYNNKGEWQGYINANAAKVADGKQGAYIRDGRKVTINKKGYNTWSNFNWKKRQSTSNLFGKTFTARGKYHHFNGEIYYSLYDNKGNWHGYVNQNAVK